MTFSKTVTCAALLLLGALGYAVAEGKVAVDPNTVPKAAQSSSVDDRLDQKVSLEVSAAKLVDVLDQLSTQSGVYIHAGTGKQDWRVREQRVTVVAKDIRLGSLIDCLSGVLRFRVSTGKKDGKTSYLFWQDHNQRGLESELITSQAEQEAQRMVATRQNALDAAAEALKMTPAQAEDAKDTDPWMAYLAGTQSGHACAQVLDELGRNHGDFRDLMLRGKETRLDLADASPELQQALGSFLQSFMKSAGSDQSAYLSALTPSAIVSSPLARESGQAGSRIGLGGMLMVLVKLPEQAEGASGAYADGMPMGFIPITGKGTLVGRIFGKMLSAIDAGKPAMEAAKDIEGDLGRDPKALAEMLGCPSQLEADPPQDPALLREVDWPYDPGNINKQPSGTGTENKDAAHLSQVLGMPVLLESFDAMLPVGVFVSKGKQPLYRLLAACEKAGFGWRMSDGSLLLEPVDWALQRSWMVAEAFVQRYKALVKKNGTLTLDELGEIAVALTDTQIQHSLSKDEDLMPVLMPISVGMITQSGGFPLLRFYGSLTTDQKQALRAPVGLAFDSLSENQYDQLLDLASSRWGGAEIVGGSISLKDADLGAVGAVSSTGDAPDKAKQPKAPHLSPVLTFLFQAQIAPQNAQTEKEPQVRAFSVNFMLPDKDTVASTRKTVAEAREQMTREQGKPDGKPAGSGEPTKHSPAAVPAAP